MNKIKDLLMFICFLIILIIIFVPEDKEWVDCSDEKDLYRYVCKISEDESIKKYRNFYKPYFYKKTNLQDYRKLLINNDSDVEEYLIKLYY